MENSFRKEIVHTINILGDTLTIFKAFCPIAEKEWVPDWECTMLYSKIGIAEKNCIFAQTSTSPFRTRNNSKSLCQL